MTSRPFSVVIAIDHEGLIGITYEDLDKNGNPTIKSQIPWKCSKDLKFFKSLTTENTNLETNTMNVVIMGKTTWKSLPFPFGLLTNRVSIIVSSQDSLSYQPNDANEIQKLQTSGVLHHATSFENSLKIASSMKALYNITVPNIFVIGGKRLFEEAFHHPLCDRIFLTQILNFCPQPPHTFACSKVYVSPLWQTNPPTFARNSHEYEESYALIPSNSAIEYEAMECKSVLQVWDRINHEESQYLHLIKEILTSGTLKIDRTQIGTKMVFGRMMRWSLKNGRLPLLTTKKTFFRGILEELIWFLKGSTDSFELSKKGINIWKGNGSRKFLDMRGFPNRQEGDLGPVYGFQWRHFGAKYIDAHSDYSNQGIDQISQIIHTLKTDPNSRRMILSAWNPLDIDEMALPPCHMMAQFCVVMDGDGTSYINCLMTQRSADVGLGVPFNIASYALLTHIIAHVSGMKPGELVVSTGDTHIYLNHIEALRIQLNRTPCPFPIIHIDSNLKDIDQISSSHFTLSDYRCHDSIKMEMAL